MYRYGILQVGKMDETLEESTVETSIESSSGESLCNGRSQMARFKPDMVFANLAMPHVHIAFNAPTFSEWRMLAVNSSTIWWTIIYEIIPKILSL